MGYTSLKFAAFLVQVFAVVMAVVVIVVFGLSLFVPATMQPLLISLMGSAGIGVTALTVMIEVAGMLSALFTCLIIFVFGGLAGAVADIARSTRSQDIRQIVPAEDYDPVTPKPWASFPDSAYQKQSPRSGSTRK